MTTHPQSSTPPVSLPKRVGQSALFGPSPVLEGEDAAAYDELFARLRAAVMPVDIIDEMFIADVASLEWELLRWRRLKLILIQACGLPALKDFLVEVIDFHSCYGYISECLTKATHPGRLEDKALARVLLDECKRVGLDSGDKFKKALAGGITSDMVVFLHQVQDNFARELVKNYARRKQDAITEIRDFLTDAGVSMDDLVAQGLVKQLDDIERIDRLTTIAENRRNACLREIERRRAVLGETLRRSVQEIEDGEFKVIETTPTKGKNAT